MYTPSFIITYVDDSLQSTWYIMSYLGTRRRYKAMVIHKFLHTRRTFPEDSADFDLNYFTHHYFTFLARTVRVWSHMACSPACSVQIGFTVYSSSYSTDLITLIWIVLKHRRTKQIIMSITKLHQSVQQNTQSICALQDAEILIPFPFPPFFFPSAYLLFSAPNQSFQVNA